MKGLLGISELGKDELDALTVEAVTIREQLDAGHWSQRPLQGRCVANVFFEPSTRTRMSFDLAAQRLGAHVLTFNPGTSSVSKGESLRDTIETVAAMGADILVVRHSQDGVPAEVADWTGKAVINAGDGVNEHPTQALVDLVTMRRHFGRLDGLEVAIVGDIVHSRVAGSLAPALARVGSGVTFAGPSQLLPAQTDWPTTTAFEDLVGTVDVVYLLRVQTERGGSVEPGYRESFQLDERRAGLMRPDSVIMHPGPVNRGVEVSGSVANSARSLIREQVANGVPARMAVLEAISL